MRVCLVSQEYPGGYVGGIGTQCRVKALGLAACGHDVEVLTCGDQPGNWLVSRDEDGVRVHELRSPGARFAVNRTETYLLGYSWAVLAALRSLAEERPFDVIDFPDYGAEGLAFQLDRQEDDPAAVVVHLHGSLGMLSEQIGWPQQGEQLHRVGAFMEDLSIQSADRLLAASASIAELTAKRIGIDRELIDVVQGAVDGELFFPSGRSNGRPSHGLRLLFVGNVAQNKGVLDVLDAFIRLAPEYPGLSLTIAGSADQEIREAITSRPGVEGVLDRLSLLGFVEHRELPELYRSCDVLLVPSRYEGGLGMVYLEAMASGLPVVARAAGGAVEAIVHGESGILLERGGVADLVAAIQTLIGDPPLRARLGAAAYARVKQHFGVERYAERVAESYARAIATRRASAASW